MNRVKATWALKNKVPCVLKKMRFLAVIAGNHTLNTVASVISHHNPSSHEAYFAKGQMTRISAYIYTDIGILYHQLECVAQGRSARVQGACLLLINKAINMLPAPLWPTGSHSLSLHKEEASYSAVDGNICDLDNCALS